MPIFRSAVGAKQTSRKHPAVAGFMNAPRPDNLLDNLPIRMLVLTLGSPGGALMRRRAGGPKRRSIARRGAADTGQALHWLVERREAPPSYVTGGRERLASVPGRGRKASARGVSQTPPTLPALHPLASRHGKRDTGAPAPQRI